MVGLAPVLAAELSRPASALVRRLPRQPEVGGASSVDAVRAFPVGIPQAVSPQAMPSFPVEIPQVVEPRRNRLARVEIRQEELL